MNGVPIPLLLTVEEAGELLRIGRTKAYAMAREWRETGGHSGLPVVDLGHVLRVPRSALEEMIGADLSSVDVSSSNDDPESTGTPQARAAMGPELPANPDPATVTTTSRRSRTRQRATTDQLDLFDRVATAD
ncbi:MAG: helix-turn-helix domain-containing protein [Acidimicrobiia bacterium]